MPVRLARLLPVALIGACLATTSTAKTHTAAGAAKPAAGPTLILRGDVTTAHGVASDVASAWKKAGHGQIEVQTFNTASGLDAVRSGAADLAGSARGSSGSADEAGLTFTPVGWDALVMITHPSNPVSSLTLSQLHDIYYGKITNWNQVGGKDEPIDLYAVASPGDGVEYSMRKLLFGRGGQPVAAPRLYVNTSKLQEGVTLDPKGLGATTFSNVAGNAKVKIIQISNVAPSVATISSGGYPLYFRLYLVTSSNGAKAAESQAFVDFVNSPEGAPILRRHDIVPYQDGAALAAKDASRRAAILAEVGARAVPTTTPVAAPGATLASRVAVAPTSERTLAAREALEDRKAKEAQAAADAKAAAANRASLEGVSGEATTVEKGAGGDFTKVASSVSDPMPTGAQSYKVSRGDTLSSIARKHSVDVADLRRWNHLASDALKPGQVLVIGQR